MANDVRDDIIVILKSWYKRHGKFHQLAYDIYLRGFVALAAFDSKHVLQPVHDAEVSFISWSNRSPDSSGSVPGSRHKIWAPECAGTECQASNRDQGHAREVRAMGGACGASAGGDPNHGFIQDGNIQHLEN